MITPFRFLPGRTFVPQSAPQRDPAALEIRSLLEYGPLRLAVGLDSDVLEPAATTRKSPLRFNRRRLLDAAAA